METVTASISGTNLTNNKFETFGIVGGFPAQPFLVPFPTTTVFASISFQLDDLASWLGDKEAKQD